MSKGYVLLHRDIWNCEQIWDTPEPFDRRSAWIDLIMMANHAEKNLCFGKTEKKIERGQLHTSLPKLAERWHWPKKKVRHYLGLLSGLEMIHTEGHANGTTITIVKYGVYQGQGHAEGHTEGHTKGHAKGHTEGHQTNKVINNVRSNEELNKRSNRQTEAEINALFEKMKKEGKL